MFGYILKFYYNSTAPIVQLRPQSIYIFGTSVHSCQVFSTIYSGTPLIRTPTGPAQVSVLTGCPY